MDAVFTLLQGIKDKYNRTNTLLSPEYFSSAQAINPTQLVLLTQATNPANTTFAANANTFGLP